jgi:hypothetical protein
MTASKEALRKEATDRRSIGSQMSNLCYNLSQGQKQLTDHDRETMARLVREWDAIPRAEKP